MIGALILSTLLLGPEVKLGLTYATVDDKPLLMDLYLPEKPVRKPVPVVVMIHGGAWMGGNRGEMTALSTALAGKGVAVANIDYRLAPKYKWPAMIVDCDAAVTYLREKKDEYGIDPDRMGSCGASAGGHLALLLGFTDGWGDQKGHVPRVKAVLNLFGPTDFTNGDFDKNLSSLVALQVFGKKFEEAQLEAADFSPVSHIDANAAPVYTIQGTADKVVPPVQADRLDAAMKKAGRPHTKVLVEGMGHGPGKDDEVNKRMLEAFDKGGDWLVQALSHD